MLRGSYLNVLSPDDVEAAIAATNAQQQAAPSAALPRQMSDEEIVAEFYAGQERVIEEMAASMDLHMENGE